MKIPKEIGEAIYDGLTPEQVEQVNLHRRLYGTAIVERIPDGTCRVIDPQTVAFTADGFRRLVDAIQDSGLNICHPSPGDDLLSAEEVLAVIKEKS